VHTQRYCEYFFSDETQCKQQHRLVDLLAYMITDSVQNIKVDENYHYYLLLSAGIDYIFFVCCFQVFEDNSNICRKYRNVFHLFSLNVLFKLLVDPTH